MGKGSQLRIQQLEKKLAHERELLDRLEQNQSALYEQLGFTSNAAERNNLNRQIVALGREIESALDRYDDIERKLTVAKENSSPSSPSNDDRTVNLSAPGNTYSFHAPVGSVGNQGTQANLSSRIEGDQISGILQSVSAFVAATVNAVQGDGNQVSDRYKALLNYLVNGRWKEADRVTYEVMAQVIGKQVGTWRTEDIENFPCEDLCILNHLWVQFSGGRFGFSVQRDIYVEIGGKLDGKYNEEIYRKFADCVRWREGGRYLDDGQLTFQIFGDKGHLPSPRWGAFGTGHGGWLFSSLAQRLVRCKI